MTRFADESQPLRLLDGLRRDEHWHLCLPSVYDPWHKQSVLVSLTMWTRDWGRMVGEVSVLGDERVDAAAVRLYDVCQRELAGRDRGDESVAA